MFAPFMNKRLTKASMLFLLTVTGCQKNIQHKQKKLQEHLVEQVHIQTLQETLARLFDIPDLPMSVTIKKIEESDPDLGQVQIFCDIGSLGITELFDYYESEMERFGWSLQGRCNMKEGLLVFVKPGGSLCVISMQEQQRMVLTIFKSKD